MAEPFFGAGPQVWPAIPGFAYISTMTGGRMAGSGMPGGMSAQPAPFPGSAGQIGPGQTGPMMTGSAPGEPAHTAGGIWTGSSAPMGGGMPPAMAFEYPGITPQALLAMVAMRRGQPMGPTSDQEMEDFIGDALDLLPGTNDVEVRLEGGRATLTGLVSHKRVKRDAGEILWAIPSITDVQNNITIATRRRSRPSGREAETGSGSAGGGRKQT